MAAEIVQRVLTISPSASREDAVDFAETSLEVSRKILSNIVGGNDNTEELAFACKLLIESALAAYRFAGLEG